MRFASPALACLTIHASSAYGEGWNSWGGGSGKGQTDFVWNGWQNDAWTTSQPAVACNPETIQGLWQYTSQTSGVAWSAYIGCTNSGVPETRCQMTDQPLWQSDVCVTIAYFDPSFISVNENGYCSFGYNDKGLVVFVPTGACNYDPEVGERKYRAKGQVTPGGVLELLFTSDGGETFYNADNVRLALNAAN